MNILKYALLGAAVAYGINYVTKKRPNGTSILDDLTKKAPEWMEKGKQYATETVNQVTDSIRQANDSRSSDKH